MTDRPVLAEIALDGAGMEIEITREMIEAGLYAYDEKSGGGEPTLAEHTEGLKAAFIAMLSESPLSHS